MGLGGRRGPVYGSQVFAQGQIMYLQINKVE